MIKIEAWFSEDIRKSYLSEIFRCLHKNGTDKIEFLPKKEIDLETLLTGTRKEVFGVSGIEEYMNLCRFHIRKSNYTKADFLAQLSNAFPKDIICEQQKNKIVYKYVQDTVDVNNQKTKRRTVTGNILPFINYFFQIIGLPQKNVNDNYAFSAFITDAISGLEKIHKPILSVIDYSFISGKLRNRILASLNIKCCPYCNRQYITVWREETGNEHATADLDHFYQKDQYPLFALSLFNFVPSCQICNSRMKGSKEIETLYPYTEGMDLFQFQCRPKNGQPDSLVDLWLAYKLNEPNKLLDLYKLSLADMTPVDKSNQQNPADIDAYIKRMRGSIEMFRLEEVYQTHLETAINEMLKIRVYFSGHYKKYAQTIIEDIAEELKLSDDDQWSVFSDDEMRDIILGFVYDGQDRIDQPLGKLLNDILEYELKLKLYGGE